MLVSMNFWYEKKLWLFLLFTGLASPSCERHPWHDADGQKGCSRLFLHAQEGHGEHGSLNKQHDETPHSSHAMPQRHGVTH